MKFRVINRELLESDPDQPRQSLGEPELQQLADSIRCRGVLQPIIVREHEGRFRVIDGHRRFTAAGIAGLTEVPVLVFTGTPDPDSVLMMQLTANCFRVDLKPTELALALQRLQQLRGWSHGQLAEAMQMSKATVTQTLSFLTLPSELQAKLDNGQLARSTAYAISREADASRRQELIQRAQQGHLKRDEASGKVAHKPCIEPRSTVLFQIGTVEFSISTSAELDVAECLTALRELTRQCRLAARQRITLRTLENVLADQAGNNR